MNKILDYNVTGQNIELSSAAMLVAGTVNEYTARFSFSADWYGYQRMAVFNADGTEREQLLTDDTCKVPWEVLLPGAYLKVGVYGIMDGSRLPTIWTTHRQRIHDGAGPTDEAADPSPVLAEQILQRMGDLGDLKTEDKSSLVAAINEVKETGGGGGTADHSKLKNRDAADQHPMSAITGLEQALEGKQDAGSYITEEADPTVPEWAKQPQKPAYTAQEVGALPDTTAIPSTAADVNAEPSGAVSQHNVSDVAHSDIRLLIHGLSERLSAVADSDDATLDQLSEVVAYIKSNRDLISAITTSKVNVSDIVDNLTTNAANKPLSAAQGVALKALIDAITVPDKLPNPNALTFTGAVTGTYDGSEPVTVNIPSGGSGSGAEKTWSLLLDETLSEDTAYIFQDLSAPVSELLIEFIAGGDGTHRDVTIFNRQGVGYGANIATFKNVLRSDSNVAARFVIHCVAFPDLAFFRCQYNNYNNLVGENIINTSSALLFDNEIGAFKGSTDFDCISIGCWSGGNSGVFKAGTKVKVYGKI